MKLFWLWRPKLNIKKVLVVDDEELICDLCKSLFEDEGIEVKIAYSGKDAIDIVKNEEFDFILSDIRMPKGDGVQFKKELNQLGIKTPFLFMTGFSDLTYEQAKELGALGILKKPFDFEELEEVIKSC
ncbi:MAG: response regulator [Deltaproteobacteria bacterium]|nr:MAG: response regulator [Deltaproteobacteria bacterium]